MNKKQLLIALEKLPMDGPIEFRFQENISLYPRHISILGNIELPKKANVKKAIIDLEVKGFFMEME